MKDIDFDELDRAVSSVLGQDNVATTVVTEEPATLENKRSEVKPTASSSTTPVVTRPKNTGNIVASRKGKFMDMVHPDAAVQPSRSLPVRAPKTLISPRPTAPTPSPVETPEITEPVATLDETHAKVGAEPLPTEPVETLSVDQTPLIIDNPEEVVTANDETSAETSDPAPVVPSTLESTVSQTSPFLSDTKVEKRPLGAGLGSVPEDEGAAEEILLPRELQPDVVEAESDKVSDTATATQDTSVSPFSSGVQTAPEPNDDGRVEGHPLFDTSTYHEPIKPVKTKSGLPGWLKWTIGLIFCVGIGAGVGYILFTAGF